MPQESITMATPSLTAQKRTHFAKLATEAKVLEKEINRLVTSFEKKNKLTCHPVTTQKNSIELVIAADLNVL